MRIVFICQWNPWALNGGALIRNAWLLRALASRYELHLVTADDPSMDVPRYFVDACTSIWRFPRTTGLAGVLNRATQALRPRSSFYTSGNVVPALRSKVHELMARDGAVAMMDLKMADALAGTTYPFMYNAHNAEHNLFARRADHERQPARSLMRLEAARIRRIEASAVRNAQLVAACSQNDREELIRLAPEASPKILVVPNGVDTAGYRSIANVTGERRTILITGSYDWRPNLIGLEWFLVEVLPALRAQMSGADYTIRVAGRMKPELARRLNEFDRVTAVPNPEEMTEELSRARIVVAPILASSGTRLRILEAWAAGRPVVTTAAGALGLLCRDGEDLLLAERPADFANAIARLLDDDVMWQRIRDAALTHARVYNWPQIGSRFLDEAGPILESHEQSVRLREEAH